MCIRDRFEREEADYLGRRAIASGDGDGDETARVGKRLARTTHVCKVTHCVLPRDEYAKGGSKHGSQKRLT